MRSIVVLLAASLVGAGGSDGPEAPQFTYQWKFLDMDGPGWRSALHAQLQPVARQGSATVWTASRETASKLAETAASVVGSPRVVAASQGRTTVHNSTTRRLVTEVTREANGPVDHASFVGFVPRVESFQEGYTAVVTGRRLDQGCLANLSLVDSRVASIHAVPLREALEAKAGGDGKAAPVETVIEVPEYARTSVSGEWLIPKDGVLIVSLGVHTVADRKGKAVAREHIAVLEADEFQAPQATAAPGQAPPPRLGMSPAAFGWESPAIPLAMSGRNWENLPLASAGQPAAVPLPMPMAPPALPSRSLPLPFDPAGQPVAMPPLPDEKTVTTLPNSAEPCASPQARVTTAGSEPLPWKKSQLRDPEANLTGLREEGKTAAEGPLGPASVQANPHRDMTAAPCCDAGAYCSDDTAAPTPPPTITPRSFRFSILAPGTRQVDDLQPTIAPRSFRFSLPLSAGFKIEVDARISPTPSPSTP